MYCFRDSLIFLCISLKTQRKKRTPLKICQNISTERPAVKTNVTQGKLLDYKFCEISTLYMTRQQEPVDPGGDFILQLEFSLY